MALGYACNEMDYINTLLYLHNIYNSLPPKHYFKNKTNELYTNITNGIQSLIEDLHYKEEHEIYFKTPKYSGICMLRTIQYNKRIILKNVNPYLSHLCRSRFLCDIDTKILKIDNCCKFS